MSRRALRQLQARVDRAVRSDRALTARDRARAWRVPAPERAAFAGVERYCMFVGYPRSGHSLSGSLLDAHPDMVIAHELDALRLVAARVDRDRLFSLVLANDRAFTQRGRRWEGYAYEVPGQWQGRVRRLRVIGDKKAGMSTYRLGRRPELLASLQELVQVPVHLVHHVRNPFDNIATLSIRHGWPLGSAIELFFSLCATVSWCRAEIGAGRWIDVRHEDLVASPRPVLSGLCRFLGQEPDDGYLDACAAVLFDAPRRTRDQVRWTADDVARVRRGVERWDFLAGYDADT
jgi:hypothetical protein